MDIFPRQATAGTTPHLHTNSILILVEFFVFLYITEVEGGLQQGLSDIIDAATEGPHLEA